MSIEIIDHCATCGDEDVVGDPQYSAAGFAICEERCARRYPYPGLDPLPDTMSGDESDEVMRTAMDAAYADDEAASFLRLLSLFEQERHRDRQHGIYMALDWQVRVVMRRAIDAWRAEQSEDAR